MFCIASHFQRKQDEAEICHSRDRFRLGARLCRDGHHRYSHVRRSGRRTGRCEDSDTEDTGRVAGANDRFFTQPVRLQRSEGFRTLGQCRKRAELLYRHGQWNDGSRWLAQYDEFGRASRRRAQPARIRRSCGLSEMVRRQPGSQFLYRAADPAFRPGEIDALGNGAAGSQALGSAWQYAESEYLYPLADGRT